MKIQYCSDLHLEFPENKQFIKNNPIVPKGEILILAGDIVPFHQINQHADFFDYVSENFEFTYWIAGNHEYYHNNIDERNGTFNEEIRENVRLVNNISVNHGNAQLILSTLWTKIGVQNEWTIQRNMNDFHVIKYKGAKLTTHTVNQFFEENLAFIKDAVATNSQEKCIVITHHVPTLQNYPEQFKNSPLTDAFAVNLDYFIADSKIDYWIYGHNHSNTPDFEIEGTQLITNQLGYVRQNEHRHFSVDKVISV